MNTETVKGVLPLSITLAKSCDIKLKTSGRFSQNDVVVTQKYCLKPIIKLLNIFVSVIYIGSHSLSIPLTKNQS